MKYIQYLLMNKLGILFFLIFVSCSSNKKIYKIEWNTKHPLVLSRYKKEDIIFFIKSPLKIVLKNNSFKTKELTGFEYIYKGGASGYLSLNKEENGSLRKLKKISRKLYMFQEKEFIIYIGSRIDTSKVFQNNFKPYLDKMKVKNKDTLHISVDKFRKNHPNLLKEITKGNEIFINIKNEGVFIPADWEDK